jgi:prepilin-type N-terminal cleavage/methylation domain-containing protein
MIKYRLTTERGMTLVEMMLALLVFSFVMGATLAFLKAQSRSFTLGSERVSMYQNNRYVLNEMEKDLRTAGAGTADQQPQIVYAGPSVVAVNANYWTNTAGDVFAVYYNPDAPDSAVQALTKAQKFMLPGTSFSYPDTSYMISGVNSGAETIIFYFMPDTSTARTDDYVLYRQVNVAAPEVVARNILQTGSTPFLQYYKEITPFGGGAGSLALVSAATLPLKHSVKIHLAPTDTGAAAIIDSLRAVRVNFTTTNGRTGTAERLRTISRLIRLPNAGLANTHSCGDPPQLGVALVAVPGTTPATIKLTWTPATDENAGEKDVERYVIWRRLSTNPDWGDPLVSIPSGQATYLYIDGTVATGVQYYYALAAQDCTPSLSVLTSSALTTAP